MTRQNRQSFFDIYADEYDLLTNAAAREEYHAKEVAALIERFQPTSVLDAGCATGLTAGLFARQGIPVVGLDRSKAMIEVAKQKFAASGLPITFQVGQFEKLPVRLYNRFDLIVCLANSISGVGTRTHLREALKRFHLALKPGGYLVLQLLNFAAVKEDELLPIKATMNEGIIYERFIERQRRHFFTYITRLDTTLSPPKLEVFRYSFDNFTEGEVTRCLHLRSFQRIEKYSDLYLTTPFRRRSRDIVFVCHKHD
ncbi:MAG: class I SAM-dependent methyltransferase [Candidatus Zixiibacteriota bacterium]|nr:MAG: class I SAM-dependent methyltransferase [candidate division Zixibacteria bacterium]